MPARDIEAFAHSLELRAAASDARLVHTSALCFYSKTGLLNDWLVGWLNVWICLTNTNPPPRISTSMSEYVSVCVCVCLAKCANQKTNSNVPTTSRAREASKQTNDLARGALDTVSTQTQTNGPKTSTDQRGITLYYWYYMPSRPVNMRSSVCVCAE